MPALLERSRGVILPVRAFDQAYGEARASFAVTLDKVTRIRLRISQIHLDDDPGMRPILDLSLGENGFEQLESGIFVHIAFHVEIDKSADLSCTAQKRPQLGREMGNCIRRIGWIHLRI